MQCLIKRFFVFVLISLNIYFVEGQNASLSKSDLESLFKNTPTSVKPFVWWHWMGSNFSKSGITKDLEAMKEEGIGGATIFNLSSAVQESHFPTLNNPWPHQTYRSPAYWDALRFAASEADRLGLEIGIHNTVGYSTTGGPWVDEEKSMQRLVWSDTVVYGGSKMNLKIKSPHLVADEGWGKTGRSISFYKDIVVFAVPADKKEIRTNEIFILTNEYNEQNGVEWNVPNGKWIVYRMCHASTGRPPHPIPDDLLGKVLEVDKMSSEQNNYHWDSVLIPIKKYLGAFVGRSFKHVLIDSYEAGNQNWTANFRKEFINRKGYDPIPWLASFSLTVGTEDDNKNQRIINSKEETQRFDWDYQDVISQLFYENGWKIGKEKIEASNLSLQMEAYGGPFNTAQTIGLADLPMTEFWTAGVAGISSEVTAAARAFGKTIIGAEAFTGRPEVSQFTEDPAFLKSTADLVFSQGVNRMILHHWVHQPFADTYKPGMGMGWWGTHFGRNQTWFEPGKAFFKYMARCQALLQSGEQVSDYLCIDKLVGQGDLISTADFLSMNISVHNGQLILPSGRTYPFIVFSDSLMLPETVSKIKTLLESGAKIVSPKPKHSPSLKAYAVCDEVVKKISGEIWDQQTDTALLKGKIYTRLEDAIQSSGIQKHFIIENATEKNKISISHRRMDSTQLFFISNQSDSIQYLTMSFDIQNRQPELWQAEDGSIVDAPVWFEKNDRTFVSIRLKGIQSIFIVFRKMSQTKDHLISVSPAYRNQSWVVENTSDGKTVLVGNSKNKYTLNYATGNQKIIEVIPHKSLTLKDDWDVEFNSSYDHPFTKRFTSLLDFSKSQDQAIKYFSGTAYYKKAVYLKSINKGERYILDLGEMNDIAEVKINGKSVGILWFPPYQVDITDHLTQGNNRLEILVTNNWANRLIGDEQEAADFEWGKDRGEEMGRAMLAYPDWFIKNQPRPAKNRKTFSVWYYYRQNSKLKPAGLVGPVNIIRAKSIQL